MSGDAAWSRSHPIRLAGAPDGVVDGLGVILSVGVAVLYLLRSFDPSTPVRLRGEGALAFEELNTRRGGPVYFPPSSVLSDVDLTWVPEALFTESVLLPAA